jgi:hypothetical protein
MKERLNVEMTGDIAVDANSLSLLMKLRVVTGGTVDAGFHALPWAFRDHFLSYSYWQPIRIPLRIRRRGNQAITVDIRVRPEQFLAIGDLQVHEDVVRHHDRSLAYPVKRVPIRLRPRLIEIDDRA